MCWIPCWYWVRNSLIVLGFINLLGLLFTSLVPESKGKSLETMSRENWRAGAVNVVWKKNPSHLFLYWFVSSLEYICKWNSICWCLSATASSAEAEFSRNLGKQEDIEEAEFSRNFQYNSTELLITLPQC
jgi:hypothetical protein